MGINETFHNQKKKKRTRRVMIVSNRFEIQHLTMMIHEPEVDYDYKTFLYHNRFTRIVKYHDSL